MNNTTWLQEMVAEYKEGLRVLVQGGGRDALRGFVLIPQRIEEVARFQLLDGEQYHRLYREVSFEEACKLSQSEHCVNKETIVPFLAACGE